MLRIADINYEKLEDLSNRIALSQDLPSTLDVEIALAINLTSEEFGNYRKLNETFTIETIASLHALGLPRYTSSFDAAKQLFELFHGKLEQPFVYSLTNDFGGLHRVRMTDAIDIFEHADAASEAAAFVAVTLKVAVLRHRLNETDR